MNNFSAKLFLNSLLLVVLIPLLISCSGVDEDSQIDLVATTMVETTIAPTETLLPTKTPKPTAVPTSTPSIEEIHQDVPECTANDSTDQAVFHELLDKLLSDMDKQEELSYTTLYRYLEDDHYPEDELSIFIEAHHDKLMEDPGGGKLFFYPMTSHIYENSSIKLTNLRTKEISEFIITEDGFWIKNSPADPWIYFEGFVSGELMNTAELFSPEWINFLFGGGSGLNPGIWTEEPEMVVEEQINGEDVLHRCWVLGELSGDIDGYLIHYESIYTFLEDTEVHLWTAENDSRLTRLVLTAKHKGERLGEEEFAEHDLTREFLFWMDILPESQTDKIQVLDQDDPMTFSLNEQEPKTEIEAAHNEFPIPPDAVPADFGIFASENKSPFIPREYLWSHYESTQSALEQFAGPGWYDIPADRIDNFKVDEQFSDVLEFYFNSMNLLGWSIEDVLYQPGWSRMYIHFKRGPVSQTTILEEHEDGSTVITGILPPDAETLAALVDGWEAYDEENSALINNTVKGIAFDDNGSIWIGSETSDQWFSLSSDGTTNETPEITGGISVMGKDGWIQYTTTNSEIISDDIWALETDNLGRIWISTDEGLSVHDGSEWANYLREDYGFGLIQEIRFDENNNLWALSWDGIGKFNGKDWKVYPHLNQIIAFDFKTNGELIIATSNGLYILEDEKWTELDISSGGQITTPFDNIADMQVDSRDQIWIVSNDGSIYIFDGEEWISSFPGDAGLDLSYIDHLEIDPNDRGWILPFSGGVYMYDPDEGWFNFSPDPIGIYIYYPNTIEIDQYGRIWIGSKSGVAVFSPPIP